MHTSLVQVTAAEGFGKTRLFEILDDLEVKTRPIMEEARQRLAKEKGDAALQPHNISHALAGDHDASSANHTQQWRCWLLLDPVHALWLPAYCIVVPSEAPTAA